eukprot:TRINITY_DN96604_c0_g1_i1.p1 TRINITY_DN96604_c0_g1~~TRINITY_DN96604_c0_g1_i1.p1  ORF type:complete len:218 (-),score=23.62 TRINITY_DN96604_c0_g1_i1:65-718(-)
MQEEVADYGEDDLNNELYNGTEGVVNGNNGDEDIEEMKRRVQEMENEHNKLEQLQQNVDKQLTSAEQVIDENSVHVGQVDYEATPEELRAHFAACGTINRVTILCDKYSGHPKGYAYIEFAEGSSVENAIKLNDTSFKGRQLKVTPKRHNEPAFKAGRGGRGGRAPFGGRGGYGRGFPQRGGRGRGPPSYGRGRGGPVFRGGFVGRGTGRGYQNNFY